MIYLQSVGLLATYLSCQRCKLRMELIHNEEIYDSYYFQCEQCRTKFSVREKSAFSLFLKLGLDSFCRIIFEDFCNGSTGKRYKEMKRTNQKTQRHIYRVLRDVIRLTFVNKFRIGGAGVSVHIQKQIYEYGSENSLKYIGIMDMERDMCRFLEVDDFSNDTYEKLIAKHVIPGTQADPVRLYHDCIDDNFNLRGVAGVTYIQSGAVKGTTVITQAFDWMIQCLVKIYHSPSRIANELMYEMQWRREIKEPDRKNDLMERLKVKNFDFSKDYVCSFKHDHKIRQKIKDLKIKTRK